MATAAAPTTVITNEERRWVVIGICLNKLLTPVLRTVLGRVMPVWYNTLCLPPNQINTQTYLKEAQKLPPSTIRLNYGNVNKNFDNHKSKYSSYDYDVKDPVSLAKLFLQPFMAKFSGFDTTMDLSAALTVICESDPFHFSGAAAQAKTVRSVRNEWAHCNFLHWTDVNFFACIQEIESLVRKLNMTPVDEKYFLGELNNWKDKGNPPFGVILRIRIDLPIACVSRIPCIHRKRFSHTHPKATKPVVYERALANKRSKF